MGQSQSQSRPPASHDEETADETETSLKRIGTLSDLARVLDKEVVDEVVLIRSQGDMMAGRNIEGGTAWGDILEMCLQLGRTVSLVDDIVPPVGAKVEAQMMGTMPTLVSLLRIDPAPATTSGMGCGLSRSMWVDRLERSWVRASCCGLACVWAVEKGLQFSASASRCAAATLLVGEKGVLAVEARRRR